MARESGGKARVCIPQPFSRLVHAGLIQSVRRDEGGENIPQLGNSERHRQFPRPSIPSLGALFSLASPEPLQTSAQTLLSLFFFFSSLVVLLVMHLTPAA